MKAPPDEKALLEGLVNSDKKAIETIYQENFNMVQALIINNNGSSDDAKDIFQDSIIVLYEKLRSGGFELNCQIKTFLYSVSRRLWLKRLQQQNRYSAPGDNMQAVVSVEEEIEAHEQRNTEYEMMEQAINHLGEPCKSLLEAYYLQKKNMQEIAASFGYTNADNAKNQKYKCLMRLKKIFFTHYKNGNGDE
ncbi:MAG: RNA polymerase sigma factor [Chitinophagaceae bacterium]